MNKFVTRDCGGAGKGLLESCRWNTRVVVFLAVVVVTQCVVGDTELVNKHYCEPQLVKSEQHFAHLRHVVLLSLVAIFDRPGRHPTPSKV